MKTIFTLFILPTMLIAISCLATNQSKPGKVVKNHPSWYVPENHNFPGIPVDTSPTPGPNDIRPEIFKRRLANLFNPEFMSISRPNNFGEVLTFGRAGKWRSPYQRAMKLVRRLGNIPQSMKRKRQRVVMGWYKKLDGCPVEYSWLDLGRRYWPRYIKRGHCNSSNRCQLSPDSLKCQPSEHKVLTLLRFTCSKRNRSCSWYNTRIPVIKNCACICKDKNWYRRCLLVKVVHEQVWRICKRGGFVYMF